MSVAFAALALIFQVFAQTPDACMVPTTSADANQDVTVATNQVFGIVLAANPTTGYSWSIAADPDPGVAAALDSQFLPPDTSLIGAPGRECFRFTSAGAGQTRVGFVYTRPFEPDAPPAQSITVQVNVAAPGVPVQLPSE